MNGDNVVSAEATTAATRPTLRLPTAKTIGIVTVPAISDGSRSSSGAWPRRVLSQNSRNESGGVISAGGMLPVPYISDSTPPSPWVAEIQYVESSSAKIDCPAIGKRI